MKSNLSRTALACCAALMLCGTGAYADSTAAVPAKAVAAPHVVGEAFGGGTVFYVTKGADGVEHGLIVAAEDFGRVAWSSNTETKVPAASKTDGVANTAAIIKAGGAATEAAGLCDAYVKDGFTDWYLPASNELELIYKNLKTIKPQFYWSSTSEYPGSAIGIDFKNGKSTASNKLRNAMVLAVRAF